MHHDWRLICMHIKALQSTTVLMAAMRLKWSLARCSYSTPDCMNTMSSETQYLGSWAITQMWKSHRAAGQDCNSMLHTKTGSTSSPVGKCSGNKFLAQLGNLLQPGIAHTLNRHEAHAYPATHTCLLLFHKTCYECYDSGLKITPHLGH